MFEQCKELPRTCLKWIPTRRVFKQIGYKWLPVKKKSEPSINKTEKFNPLGLHSTLSNYVEPLYQRIPNLLFFALMCSLSKCASGHMTGNKALLKNFVAKFLGIVRFGNDHIAKITGYGDLIHNNVTIQRVYFVEGLGHKLFSIGQFCDNGLEVAFRQHTCIVRTLDGVDILKGSRESNLYQIALMRFESFKFIITNFTDSLNSKHTGKSITLVYSKEFW